MYEIEVEKLRYLRRKVSLSIRDKLTDKLTKDQMHMSNKCVKTEKARQEHLGTARV